jgi:thiol-disulfide isomerase/thioredoxin
LATELTAGLPAEFLSTPLGQALKPSIDQMFQGSNANEHSAFTRGGPSQPAPPPQPQQPQPSNPNPQDLASMLLGAVAQQAAGSMGANGANPSHPQASIPETSPLTLVTSFANWTSILKNHRAVVANFTNTEGCPPCRMIKPAYEAMAETYAASHGSMGVRFVEIEMGVGEGQNIASQYSVRATPTFIFFKDGVKADEMAGADHHADRRARLPRTPEEA